MMQFNILAVFATLLVFGLMGCKKDEAAIHPTPTPTQPTTPTPSSYKGATVAN